MGGPYGIERRDPVSGVLTLGSILSRASRRRESGYLEVRDKGLERTVKIIDGYINSVTWTDAPNIQTEPEQIRVGVEELFTLPRPHVTFEPSALFGNGPVDPRATIIGGMVKRTDLFEPLDLLERIPASAVRLDPKKNHLLAKLPLGSREQAFVACLKVPTPVAMLLWKRGLEPRHAGALLVALNLLGLFEGWESGQLPRPGAATRIQRKTREARPDCELLGVSSTATVEEIDRAFRKLSYELHPDRLLGLPPSEVSRAQNAFLDVSAAHARLKRSRRRRPTRCTAGNPVDKARASQSSWLPFVAQARRANQRGETDRARIFAVKALALCPPPGIKQELLSIIKRVA